jgi:hypothetical protein
MLQATARYEFVPYDKIAICPFGGQEEDQMQEDDPRFIPLIENIYGSSIAAAKTLLRDEIELCDVAYSGMQTACIIETERPDPVHFPKLLMQMHTGHRVEALDDLNGFTVVTAVEMALRKFAHEDEKICGVFLTGRDLPGGKVKRLMPIPTDYDHIAARFSMEWGPPFFILSSGSYEQPGLAGVKWVLQNNHVKSYAQHERIDLSKFAEDFKLLTTCLRYLTPLNKKDTAFVADLTGLSADQNWDVFFTGSASGFGEITPALTDEYDDMDFIVAAGDPDEVEASITKIAEQHYGRLMKVPELAYDTYGGKKIPGFFLFSIAGKRLVQLAIGKTIEQVCFRPDVIARNSGIWLHKSK